MRIKIGFEHEFGVFPYPIPNEVLKKLDLIREYYAYQVEFNKLLYNTDINNLDKVLYHALKEILKKGIQINKEFAHFVEDNKVFFSEFPYYLKDNGSLIFNGLHIHISFPEFDMYELGDKFKTSYTYQKNIIKWVVWQKLSFNPDFRFIFSHHIWGNIRYSNYEFKKKKKFKPIVFTNKNTFEIRMFSFFDLMYYRDKISQIIQKLAYYLTKFKTPRLKRDVHEYLKDLFDNTVDYFNLSDIYKLLRYSNTQYKINDEGLTVYLPQIVYVHGKFKRYTKAFYMSIPNMDFENIEENEEVLEYASI